MSTSVSFPPSTVPYPTPYGSTSTTTKIRSLREKKAFDWLQKAFGIVSRERVADEDGRVVHGELVLGSGVLMVMRAGQRSRWASPKALRAAAAAVERG